MATKAMAMSRAFAILAELQSTLNVQDGGDVARQLDALYAHMNDRLVDANIQRVERTDPRRDAPADAAARRLVAGRDAGRLRSPMTFDEVVLAYTAGLDAEIALLQQVEALAAEQRAAWARDELLPLGALGHPPRRADARARRHRSADRAAPRSPAHRPRARPPHARLRSRRRQRQRGPDADPRG